MPKFDIRWVRDVTECADVEIEADTKEAAIEKAQAMEPTALDWYRTDGSEWDTRIDYENVEEVTDE